MINKELYGHWKTEDHLDTNKYIGFTYEIINTINNRKYLGKKKYSVKKKKDDWKTYTGSCVELNNDIKEFGKDKFTFVVLQQHTTMAEMNYIEAKNIIMSDAIFRLDYYNKMLFLRTKGKKN